MVQKCPLISILVCNYNYSNYIEESLKSAFNQTYPNIEIIVIDDGSTDNSLNVIEGFRNNHPLKTVKVIAKNSNEGICPARNQALDVALGEYVLFLDSDDTIPRGYVQKFYETAVKYKADITYGDFKIAHKDKEEISNFPEYDFGELTVSNYINISSLIKKSSIRKNAFDTNLNRRSHEDYDFWLGLALRGAKFKKVSGIYLNYRQHEGARNIYSELFGGQAMEFIEVWKYIIDKYKKLYPDMINNDVYFLQLRHQLTGMTRVERDLKQLITSMQAELTTTISVSEKRTTEQDKHTREQDQHIRDLEHIVQGIINSKRYKLANKLALPRSILKSVKNRVSSGD